MTSKITVSSELESRRVSAVERVSGARSVEQVNESAVRSNEQADKRVAQYLHPDSRLF